MTAAHITVGGLPVRQGSLYSPGRGVWFAQLELVGSAAPTAGELRIGDAVWQGVIAPGGRAFGEQWRGQLVGGKGGWAKLLPRKGYHNDAGVKAATVIADLARECGEALGTVNPGSAKLRNDYARESRLAAESLTDAARGVPWWIGRDGITHVKARTGPAVTTADVLRYEPAQGLLEFVLDDLRLVDVGSVVTDSRLPRGFVIGSLDIHFSPSAIRCVAWEAVTADPLSDALMTFAASAASAKLHGVYRYRVIGMSGRRVNLQAVDNAPGVPDLLTVPQWPGIAGAHADLLPGGQVLVQFVAGDRSDPVVTQYIGDHAAVPTKLELGGANGAPANAQGDAVEVLLPPAVFSGTIGGVPASGVLSFPSMKAQGVTTGGHPLVRIK